MKPQISLLADFILSRLLGLSKFDSKEKMIANGFKLLLKIIPELGGNYDSGHYLYSYANANDFSNDEDRLRFYIGETYVMWARLKLHFMSMRAALRLGKTDHKCQHDLLLFQSLKDNTFFYTHVGLPKCHISLIRFLESVIVLCLCQAFSEGNLINIKKDLTDHEFDFSYDDIIAIGAVILANMFEKPCLEIDVSADTFHHTEFKINAQNVRKSFVTQLIWANI